MPSTGETESKERERERERKREGKGGEKRVNKKDSSERRSVV